MQVRLRSRAAEEYARTPRRPVVRRAGRRHRAGARRHRLHQRRRHHRGDNEPSPTPVSESTAPATPLTFGIYGPRDEVVALQGVVDNYNSLSESNDVRVRSWPDHESMAADLRAGDDVPDVFMASRDDLAWLQEQQVNQPVDELLDERGVDFGDNYSRDALLAFSEDNRLQCMPYDVSPTVIFYNKELIDFEKMIRRGLDAPDLSEGDTRWSFDQFAAAADFATRPRLPHPRRARRPHAAQPRAVRLLRWRGAVRRRGAAHVAGVLRRGHPRRPGAHARAAPQPAPDAQRAAARPGDAAHVVQARSARHDRGRPVAGARAADRAGPGVRRACRCPRWTAPPPSATSPASASRATPRTPPRPRTSWSTRSPPPR